MSSIPLFPSRLYTNTIRFSPVRVLCKKYYWVTNGLTSAKPLWQILDLWGLGSTTDSCRVGDGRETFLVCLMLLNWYRRTLMMQSSSSQDRALHPPLGPSLSMERQSVDALLFRWTLRSYAIRSDAVGDWEEYNRLSRGREGAAMLFDNRNTVCSGRSEPTRASAPLTFRANIAAYVISSVPKNGREAKH